MSLWKLSMIGNGSGLSRSMAKTSWYMIQGKTMYIFDFPYSNIPFFASSKGKKILESVDKIRIFLTHMHEDHIGGIVNFGFLNKFTLKKDLKVFVPTKLAIKMMNYVMLLGGEPEEIGLQGGDVYQDDDVQIFPRAVAHVGNLDCFAYVVYGNNVDGISSFISPTGNNWSIYYSGDNATFMDEATLATFIEDADNKMVYHDMTYNIENIVHCYYQRAVKALKKSQRKNVVPIHLDNESDKDKLGKLGFNTDF